MAGPAEGTIFQGKPGSVAEGSDPSESEPYHDRVGQKTRELRKKEPLRKQQARDRGEEIGSDDDDDDDGEEFDEVAAGVDWDVLEGEDSLTGTQLST